MRKDEDLDSLYDAVIREKSLDSLLKLATALAERTPGENTFAQERERTRKLFEDRLADLRLGGTANQSTADKFMQEKLYELRQWLCFLRYTYAGARASSETALQLRRAEYAVQRIHSLRLEQAGRETEKTPGLFKKIRKVLDTSGALSISLQGTGAKGSLALSRSAYIRARRGLWRVYLRSCGRALLRHVFLLAGGFFLASYLLGMLPEMLRLSNSAIVNGVLVLLGTFGAWAVDRWMLSPRIDRLLERSRLAHLIANIGDLLDALLWAHLCRVFSSSVLHEMIESANVQYQESIKGLTDPSFPPGGYGITT